MMAAFYGTPSAVKLLLEAGADPSLRNEKDLTAIDFAQRAKPQNPPRSLQHLSGETAQGQVVSKLNSMYIDARC